MSTKPNGADIAAVVVAILLPLTGFVIGLVRRGQWKAGGMQPPTAVTLAIVLGAVFTVGQLLAVIGITAYVGFATAGY